MSKLKIGTDFLGVGAFEQVLIRMEKYLKN